MLQENSIVMAAMIAEAGTLASCRYHDSADHIVEVSGIMAPTGFFNNLAGLPWSGTLLQQEVTWMQANT